MENDLLKAEALLARGDYSQCLEILEPLAKANPLPEKKGASICMLMVTAWMGQGEEEKAIITCRTLSKCKDSKIQESAKQLLSVLEAPSLERPSNWKIHIPKLGLTDYNNQVPNSINLKKKKEEKPKPPPTGPTPALKIGFAIFVLIFLTLITFLLS